MGSNANFTNTAIQAVNAVTNTPLTIPPLSPTFIYWAVFASAFLAVLVASIMSDEQNERLRNGTFGAIAGSSIGGLAALLTSQATLLIVGFLGSAAGALAGWFVIIGLSIVARTPEGRDWLEYYVGGFKALRARIDIDDKQMLLTAVGKWRIGFSKMIDEQKNELLLRPASPETDIAIRFTIKNWLVTSTEFFGLMFDTLAKKPEYRSRSELIVFGTQNNKITGKMWVSHIGSLPGFAPIDFDESSVAYRILSGKIESPHFTTKEEAKKDGQDRGRPTYRPFYSYKVHKCAVLVIDWPEDLPEKDDYVEVAIDIVRRDIGPAVEALLAHWSVSLSHTLGMAPLL